MTAAELQFAPNTEAERIEHWRKQELERAGYRRREAAELAARVDVDLHVAVALLERGCPRETALAILL